MPPRVKPKPADGNIVVKKGTEVTLECSASGNPVPVIKWTREVSHLSHQILISDTLTKTAESRKQQ